MAHKSDSSLRRIDSPDNSTFKLAKKLLASHGIKKENKFIVSGAKVILELARSDRSNCIETLFLNEVVEESLIHSIVKAMSKSAGSNLKVDRFKLKATLFREIDIVGTDDVLAICKSPQLKVFENGAVKDLEVFLALSDPNNLGAAIRSCVAFGASKIVLCKECANPFLPKVIKASSGAALFAPLYTGPSIVDIPSNNAKDTVIIDQGGQTLFDFKFPPNIRLVLGREGEGIPDNLKHLQKVTIPIDPKIESLNAMVALGIVLSQARKDLIK